MGGRFEKPCPIPSRRAERATSRNNRAMYSEEIWQDILRTWAAQPNLFSLGCGQSTLHYAIYHQTNREWPSHHIRRVLQYAVNAGHVEYLHDHGTRRECTRFKLLNKNPLPKPGPRVNSIPDIVESNGKTIRENNMTIAHKIPVGTLVEIIVTPENAYCFERYAGTRLFVSVHARDCDGTPLYDLSPDRCLFDNVDMNDMQDKLLARMNIISGIVERDLRVVDLAREAWSRVPAKGEYVIADHPITNLNPSFIFRVLDVKTDLDRFWVRGEKTCWFSINKIRPPTDIEAADLSNYRLEEL